MAFLKPQSPLSKGNDYFYPLTTADQVIMDGGYRLDQIVGKVEKSTVTLYQNGWSAAAPYSYSIMVKGLADNLNMKVLPHYPENFAEKQVLKEEFAKVSFCSRQGNIVTFECWDEVPSINIDVDIEVNVLYPLEAAIDMDEIESQLPKLNYSIVGGITEPANPTENMIWVNTDVEITSHVFNKNEPKNPIEGMIWIYINNTSNVNFYKLKYGDIGIDEVYPISAKQYVSGAWVGKTAKSYQGGEWVDWTLYLYNEGDEYIDVTGGWSARGVAITSGFTASVPTLSKKTDRLSISFKPGKTNHSGVVEVANDIDLTAKNTVYVELSGSASSAYISVYVVNRNAQYYHKSAVAQKQVDLTADKKSVPIDISSVPSGAYNIAISPRVTTTSTGSLSCDVFKVWAE